MTFPEQHRVKVHSAIPLKLSREVKRRAHVDCVFPKEDSTYPPDWCRAARTESPHQYMQVEDMTAVATPHYSGDAAATDYSESRLIDFVRGHTLITPQRQMRPKKELVVALVAN